MPFLLRVGSKGEELDAKKVLEERTLMVAGPRSGKTSSMAVICEELAKLARTSPARFAIIDPMGNFVTLKKRFPLIWVGEARQSDVKWDVSI
ncbi:MAG: hypothetical protein JRN41_02245, partial [Nitrososphaerota archaeon]|nr:hypothetical protein [Nitrososphaerota archaeon]